MKPGATLLLLTSLLGGLWISLAGCGSSGPLPARSHVPGRVLGAVDQGPVDGDQVIDVLVGLTLRNEPLLPVLHAAQQSRTSPLYQRYLSPSEFGEQFGAREDDYSSVVAWMAARQLTVVRVAAGRTALTVRGTVRAFERAFHTVIDRYADGGGSFRAPRIEPRLDPAIAELVDGMVGLDDASGWWSHRSPVVEASPNAKTPIDLRAMYSVDKVVTQTHDGQGATIAILGTGNPPPPSDIDLFISTYALATNRAAQYTQVFVGGPNRDPDSVAQNEQFENALDAEMVIGIAPKANVVHVLTATNSPGLFSDGIVYIVNELPQAHAVSVSYGTCERGAASEMPILNHLFAQAKAQGQQWFFASGDSGGDGCRDGSGDKILSADWPASSPFVIGVGGTTLNGTTGAEEAWSSGGGGQSESLDKPLFQAGVGPYPNDHVRDVPDVAALAGFPGVAIVLGGAVMPGVQGTSVAAPIWAAIWALLDAGRGGGGLPTGLESLYLVGKAGRGFTDITVGGNVAGQKQAYVALPGFDLATGWGSPNLLDLLLAWR